MKKLDGFQLKIIALVLMLMDHLYVAFPTVFPAWFHPLSRIVAPIFAYLMVEGFFHTRNKLKYNLRLWGWALFMEVGNRLLNIVLASKGVEVHNNIFITLALGLTLLNLIELAKKNNGIKRIGLIVVTILLLPLSIFVEGGIAVIPLILAYNGERGLNNKFSKIFILCILPTSLMGTSYITIYNKLKNINIGLS